MLSRLDPQLRRLLLRIPLAAAAAFLIWYAAGSEIWGRSLTSVTETVLRLSERPPTTFLSWEDGTIQIRRSDFSSRSQLPVFDPSAVDGNTVLFLALALATPGIGTRTGLLGGALGALLLFLSQVAHLALAIETIYATQLGAWSLYAYERWQREVVATGRYFFDISLKYALPFVFWGIFVLLPELKRSEAATEARAAEVEVSRRRRKKRR
jgi:hypothetical protein